MEVTFKDRDGHLGDFIIRRTSFEGVGQVLDPFLGKNFLSLSGKEKINRVNETLLSLILKEEKPSFLLARVLDFFDQVKKRNILEHYSFSNFEVWLNQFSGLNSHDNYQVRGQIVGKWVPRE